MQEKSLKIKNIIYVIGFILIYFWVSFICAFLFNSDLAQIIANLIIIVCFIWFIIRTPRKVSITDKIDIFLINAWLTFGVLIITSYMATFIKDTAFEQYSSYFNNLNPKLLILSTLILAPIAEEIIFRGLVFKYLRNANISFFVSAISSSIIFALFHGTITHLLPAFLLAFYFCEVYEYTGNIIYNILCHVLYNVLVLLLGSFIINMSIIYCFIVLICIIFILVIFYKRKVMVLDEH